MAKRYKENKKNKFLRNLVCIVIIAVIIYLVYKFFIKKNDEHNKSIENLQTNIMQEEQQVNYHKESKNEDSNPTQESNDAEDNDNISLIANAIVPRDLENEIRSKLEVEIKNAEVVKIHYQLKSLEEGIVHIYYKSEEKIYSVQVEIASRKITECKTIEDDNLAKKSVIKDNLDEDVKQDFEKYKDKLNGENSRLNIIITNTEIIINVSYV